MPCTEKLLTLMCKDYPILQAIYDYELHAFTRILNICDMDHAPPGILDHKDQPNRRTLNDWYKDRAIPPTRLRLSDAFPDMTDPVILAEKNMGLSLSDRYWLKNDPDIRWKDVNFFDNPFSEDLGRITLGQASHTDGIDMFSPNTTLNGDLQKKWTLQDGRPMLLKAGSEQTHQEVWNEAAASALHARLLDKTDFVPYHVQKIGRKYYSACPNMLGPDEEFVPMWDLTLKAVYVDGRQQTCCP